MDAPGQDPNRCRFCGHDWHGLPCLMSKGYDWPAAGPSSRCPCPSSFQEAPC